MKTVLKYLIALFIYSNVYAQSDKIAQASSDSLLENQQLMSKELLSLADSFKLHDSIQQVELLSQIADLKANDQKKKGELQQRLDSLNKAREIQNNRIKAQVDSLRANTKGVPVIFYDDTLFLIYSKLGPFTPSDRAKSIADKLSKLVDDNIYDEGKLIVFSGEESDDIMFDEMIVLSITDRDAFWLDESRENVAREYIKHIKTGIKEYKERTGLMQTLKRILMLILVLAIFFFGIKYMNKGFTQLNVWLINKIKPFIRGVKFKNYEFLSIERETDLVKWGLKIIKWLIIIIVIYLALPSIFSIFPTTKGIATTMFGYVFNPIKEFGGALIGYIPELITIVVIVFLTRYFVRFLKFLSSEVENGNLQLPGFYPDWAIPTFNLLKILIYAFSFIVIFPYLPGSDSPVFQGVSVFLGVLFSLGSSSAIGNIIAGLVITYMRAFKIGDRVKIGDITGDVIEKTMLVTRLRTIKNEDITIPNAAIMNGSTVNYSSSAEDLGLILNSMVTIGYDVPWRKVHELLIGAALKTEHIKHDPKPFVFQTSLDDFYVSYQINAYTENASLAAKIYSELHSNIQDAFNENGVEILSPHYRAARDGNMVTIPPSYLPPNYKAPSFNVNINKDGKD
ncbi:MAG: mechanosensitive ion channel [Flavobacteriales bacterium]|nr:mechanosensitive ion channel [Flavobacteriales bacterium]